MNAIDMNRARDTATNMVGFTGYFFDVLLLRLFIQIHIRVDTVMCPHDEVGHRHSRWAIPAPVVHLPTPTTWTTPRP